MNSQIKTKIKRDLGFLKKVEIKDIRHEHIDEILSLIRNNYGNEYPDAEFYNQISLKKYITHSINRTTHKIYWRGAFFQNKLIAQILFIPKHGTGFLNLTMVHNDYQDMGVLSLLGSKMMKVQYDLKISDMRCTYAIVNNTNIPMIQILKKFKFVRLGTLPAYNHNKFLLIYGRVFKDFNWKMIKPYLYLSPEIYKKIKKAKLKRIISTDSAPILSSKKIEKNIHIERIKRLSNNKILFYFYPGDKCAELIENCNQKSWYDVRLITEKLNFNEKKQIFEKIIDEFNTSVNVNSISFTIDINDRESQRILLSNKMRLYAYLPYYYYEKDMLLIGYSKIEEGGK